MSGNRSPRQLVLLVDALGWLTVERTGFLSDLLPHRRKLETVFGYSSTAIPSLLTGALPERHGHWFLYRRAQENERPFGEARWLARLPRRIAGRWSVRMKLQEYWRRKAGIRGYFSLYNVPWDVLWELAPTEREDTWATDSFPDTPTLIDHLLDTGVSYHVSDWRRSDEQKLTTFRARLESGDAPDVAVLYLTGIDSLQHRVGTLAPELDHGLVRLEQELRSLIGTWRRAGPVGVTLFSDHGMTDISGTRDLLAELDRAGLRRNRDYRGFFDSTVARFWDVREPDRLKRLLDGFTWGRRLTDGTLAEWGVTFPDRRYGEIFFLVEPGLLIVPSDMGAEPLAAMHGYDPAHPTSDACLLADVPLELERDHITSVLPALLDRFEAGR